MEATQYTRDQISLLPNEPGIYKFFNEDGKLIYVGKAKSIKKRVSSYFGKSQVDRKTIRMVSEIAAIEFTIVNSEFDAFLLENNLIKTNQPKYNIRLKDDKTFPYICVSNERFPRIYSTRKVVPEWGTYYGPYASVKAMNNVLHLLRDLYTIRTCRLNLSEENIKNGKFKVCLEYHIGNCQGPCADLQTEDDYNHDIEQAVHILKGNLSLVRNHFKDNMQRAAENLEFELAQKLKNKLDLLEKFQSRSLVVNQKITDVDVFTIISDDKDAYINYLKIHHGTIIVTKTIELKKKLNENESDLLSMMIIDLRDRFKSVSKEIITNVPVELPLDNVILTLPKIGDKKKLTELSVKNTLHYKKEKLSEARSKEPAENRVLRTLQNDLQLKNLPKHIECFDNSNIQGTNPVASMVCFRNGKPAKRDYRKYHIKTVVGPDDFASMYEVNYRRYKRLIEENQPLPDLIVIDGGKGQLNAACDALKALNVYGQIPIIGIAKRLEEIYYPEDQYPLHIDKKSESLVLLQKLRDEAHRFAITFHRNQRSKNSFKSELDDIKGIGSKTIDKLLAKFKSVKKVREASLKELETVVGSDKASLVKAHFKN
ncbi:excinuclease ABC subunit UvrC [Fulvivirgaceae bacterium BMA10]|uniref:UvrABC system protein C n=1 Tax=Splendidivirga corallicola TaxID=3051826 RepID=A0ABT8KTH3_9BACT|nr:excinuclease ABC subunit UvrC [Fulvivirgaceae bacterium BMA10]